MKTAGDQTFAFFQQARIEHLTVIEALALMADFYRTVRAEDCNLAADGDMLLFQWGTFTWRGADEDRATLNEAEARFEYNITRQLIPAGQDDVIAQLSLTFRYAPSVALQQVGAGNRWCSRPAELEEFVVFAREHLATAAVARLVPVELRVTFENAE